MPTIEVEWKSSFQRFLTLFLLERGFPYGKMARTAFAIGPTNGETDARKLDHYRYKAAINSQKYRQERV